MINFSAICFGFYWQHEQLANFIQEMFVAGSGTAANTLYWALLCLIHHPDAQTKIRQEVIDNFGKIVILSLLEGGPYFINFKKL